MGEVVGQVLDGLGDPDGPPDLALLFVTPPHAGALEDAARAIRDAAPARRPARLRRRLGGRRRAGRSSRRPASPCGRAAPARSRPSTSPWPETPDGQTFTGWPDDDPRRRQRPAPPPRPLHLPDRRPPARAWTRTGPACRWWAAWRRPPGARAATGWSSTTGWSPRGRSAPSSAVVADGDHRRVPGLPAGRQPVRRHPGRAQHRLRAGRQARPRAAAGGGRGGLTDDDRRAAVASSCRSAGSSTSASSTSAGATSSSATWSAPTPAAGRSWWATSSRWARPPSSRCATRRRPTRTCASWSAARSADAALLFTCNGRGTHLFPEPHHDASVVSESLGGAPLAGMFCAGELGPIGGHNFVHGFTASVVLLSGP